MSKRASHVVNTATLAEWRKSEARLSMWGEDASDAMVAILRRAAARDPGPLDWLAVEECESNAAASTFRRVISATGI